jgi:hypothetical protein
VLFCADASTRGINPDFYIKMLCVIGGVVLVARTRRRVFEQAALDGGPIPGARALAWGSLGCWFGAIVAGRLIAYVGPVAGI